MWEGRLGKQGKRSYRTRPKDGRKSGFYEETKADWD